MLLRRAFEIESLQQNLDVRVSWFRSIVETTSLYFGPDMEIALLATMSFRRLKSLVKQNDPYRVFHRKEKLVSIARERAEKLRSIVENRENPSEKLAVALRISSLATIVEHEYSVLEQVEPPGYDFFVNTKIFGRDDSSLFIEFIRSRPRTIAFIPASVAELPYDFILLDIMKKDFNAYITAFVRNGAFEDYTTIEDAEALGLDEHVDDVVDIGSDAATVLSDEVSNAFEKLIESDIVVVKGTLQTLHYANNRLKIPVLGLFYTKCQIAASVLGVEPGKANILWIEALSEK